MAASSKKGVNAGISDCEGKIFRWYNNIAYTCLGAGFLCIIAGIITLIDAVQQEKHKNKANATREFSWGAAWDANENSIDNNWTDCILRKNALPGGVVGLLILFGIVSSVAWYATSVATKKLLSINATSRLGKGIRQRDLSAIFEFRFSKSWFLWRWNLWLSSLFTILCFICFVSVGLTYRLAFTPRLMKHRYEISGRMSPLLGCNPQTYYSSLDDYYGTDEEQHFLGLFGSLAFLQDPIERANAFNDVQQPVTNGWNVSAAWLSRNEHDDRSFLDFTFMVPTGYAYWTAPFFMAISQPVIGSKPILGPRLNQTQTLAVKDHPTCGPLLQLCRETDCLWLGLATGDIWVQQMWGLVMVAPANKFIIDYAEFTPRDATCPLVLDPNVYQLIAKELEVDVPTMHMPFDTFSRTVAQNLILAHLMSNVSLIPNSTAEHLKNLGMMTNGTTCGRPTTHINGTLVYKQREGYFQQWEFGTATGLVLWGILLLLASFPNASFVVAQTIDQWMSFGADIGADQMQGASSGRKSASSETVFRVVTEERDDGTGRVTLTDKNAGVLRCDSRPRLRYGLRYE